MRSNLLTLGALALAAGCANPTTADPRSSAGTGGSGGGMDLDVSDAGTDGSCESLSGTSTSYGCEFWSLKLDTDMFTGGCFAAYIANASSDQPVHIEVERAGQPYPVGSFARIPKGQGLGLTYEPYDAEAGLPPGEVAILFLDHAPNTTGSLGSWLGLPCPVTPAIQGVVDVSGSGRGHAFRIKTDRPVAAYQVYPYGGGNTAIASATLLLPSHAWDTDHLAVNAYPVAYNGLPPTLSIVAREDTDVTITPVVDIVDGPVVDGKVVEGTPKGVARTYPLERGEYLQITQAEELTGSRIKSTKPVGLFGGSTCFNVPQDKCCCDSGQQQIPPLRALGSEYVAVRYGKRTEGGDGSEESVPWRLVGSADGTLLSYEPSAPDGAPSSLSKGQVVEFWAPGPFVVKSQDAEHPFYAAAYMTSGTDFGGAGDSDWVNLGAVGQYLNDYVFFTDPTYPETELVVIRARAEGGAFAPVTLDCRGELGDWTAVGAYEYTRVRLVTGDFDDVGTCSNGRQRLASEGPVGVTVWGWGSGATGGTFGSPNYSSWCSYAYLAAAGVNSISVPPPE